MSNQLTTVLKTENSSGGSDWDTKRVAGLILGLILLSAAGYAFAVYLLPFLITLAWNLVELVVAGVIAVFLLAIIFNGKFWRAMRYLTEGIAQALLGWVIEMNPWTILQNKIDEARKDREQLRVQGAKLKAQQDSLSDQLKENEEILRLKQTEIKIVQAKLQQNPKDDSAQENYEIATNAFTNAKTFIDGLKPTYNDVCKLVAFTDKAYRKSGIALSNSGKYFEVAKGTI